MQKTMVMCQRKCRLQKEGGYRDRVPIYIHIYSPNLLFPNSLLHTTQFPTRSRDPLLAADASRAVKDALRVVLAFDALKFRKMGAIEVT